jgi:hypothetical protein
MSIEDDERVLERCSELSRELDAVHTRLLRALRTGDAEAGRRILAGPLEAATLGTLGRLRSTDP